MIKYYPYAANDGKHKCYIMTESGRKCILELLVCLILQYIKMKHEKLDILIDITIMRTRLNQESLRQGSGVDGTYGTNQQSNSHIMILRHDIYNIENMKSRDFVYYEFQNIVNFFTIKKSYMALKVSCEILYLFFLPIFHAKFSTQFFMQNFQHNFSGV
jgi:hypothetical protein